MRERKILYVSSTLARRGPIIQLYALVRHLDRRRFDPHVLTLSPEPDESLWHVFQALGVNVHSLALSRFSGAIRGTSLYRGYVSWLRPDLVHSQGIRSDVLTSLLGKGTARVCTVHNIPEQDYSMRYGRALGRVMVRVHTSAWRKVDAVAAVSNTASENLKANYDIDAVAVPNGVDVSVFSPPADPKPVIRDRLGLPKDKLIFVVVGHLSEIKDPETVAKGFIHANLDGGHLVFVGGGKLRGRLEQICRGNQNVSLIGRVLNVKSYLQASDVIVSASRTEGIGLTTIEGMACGLPCLLSNIPAHREIADLCSSAVSLFGVQDEIDLSAKMRAAAGQDIQQRGKEAVEAVRAHLSAARMSERYQRLYEELLAR